MYTQTVRGETGRWLRFLSNYELFTESYMRNANPAFVKMANRPFFRSLGKSIIYNSYYPCSAEEKVRFPVKIG